MTDDDTKIVSPDETEMSQHEELLEGDEKNSIVEESQDIESGSDEVSVLKVTLARQQADYENFKKRVERDRLDMMYFLRADILGKILPRVDDLERIILSTPEEAKSTPMFKWLEAIYTNLVKDLEKMWVKTFVSKGESVDPEKHDVMTQSPGEEGKIIDEFAKWYMLADKVLRHAKVVVGNGVE